MLRVTVHQDVNPVVLLLEGKLIGDWVEEVRAVWNSVRSTSRNEGALISLTAVSAVDTPGRHLLTEIYSKGGVLIGTGLFARTLIQEITEGLL